MKQSENWIHCNLCKHHFPNNKNDFFPIWRRLHIGLADHLFAGDLKQINSFFVNFASDNLS